MQKQICMVVAAVAMTALVSLELAAKPRPKQIPSGAWGGPNIQIEVQDGSATIEYDCASGVITGPLKLDRKGRFKLSGTHTREHGGPIRVDRPLQKEPARYSGWTDGKKMTLLVTLANTNEQVGSYTLVSGQQGRIHKCR